MAVQFCTYSLNMLLVEQKKDECIDDAYFISSIIVFGKI